MTSRERVRCTLEHKQPDKMALDFGGCMCTGIQAIFIEKLRDYYGLDKHPIKITEPFLMLGQIEDDLKDILKVDCAGFAPRGTFFGQIFPAESWKELRVTMGSESTTVLIPEKFMVTEDGRGGYYTYPQGDISLPPSGHMPAGSFYFDSIIRQEPIDEDNLNPEDNLEEFQYVTDEDIEYFRENIIPAVRTGRAVVVDFGGSGLGDISMVPGACLKHPKGIRDVQEWYISTVTRQDYLHEVFSKQTDIAIQNFSRYQKELGDMVDVVFVCGADFGTQISQFCSVDTFEKLYLPYYQKMNGWIHEHTNWKTLKHSCGAIEPLIPSLIKAGFDIINPVQCSAVGMDPQHLKEAYGKDITFWGGGVDTQKVLPYGSPREVREQVLERCEIFSKGGGFVFNAIHNIQANTPVENFVAMIDAVHEFNGDK